MKFAFNKKARTAAMDALKKLNTFGSSAAMLVAFAFPSVSDKVAMAIGAFVIFVVSKAGIIFLAGLEDDVKTLTPKVVTKVKAVRKPKPKSSSDDTS